MMKHLVRILFVLALTSTQSLNGSAGVLDLSLKNVNANDPALAIDTATGIRTIDSPDLIFATVLSENPVDPHAPAVETIEKILSSGAALASERVVSPDHPFEAHFEVNVTRHDPESSLPEFLPDRFLMRIEIAGATFKSELNGEDIIRDGHFDNGTFGADVLGNTGMIGESIAEVLVENLSMTAQTDFGLVLPLQSDGGDNDILTPCEPITLRIQIFSATGFGGAQPLGAPDSITLLTCERSFGFEAQPLPIKLDFETDFKSFLDRDHNPVDIIKFGAYKLQLWPNIFDAKSNAESVQRRIGFDNVNRHELSVQFEDLNGIAAVNLVLSPTDEKISAILNRAENSATFLIAGEILQNAEVKIEQSPNDASSMARMPIHAQSVIEGWFEVTAFPADAPKFINQKIADSKGRIQIIKIPTGVGAIVDQIATITQNKLVLTEPCKDRDGRTIRGGEIGTVQQPKHICETLLPTNTQFQLNRTGESFGPFDWVSQANSRATDYFRVSGIPATDGHGNSVDRLDGLLTLKNSSNDDVDGIYKFSLPFDETIQNRGANGVYLIGPMVIRNALIDAGISGNFGTADISFTFFVNSSIGSDAYSSNHQNLERYQIDIDRLIVSNGKFIAYGDNANDNSSEHAVSGDEGRFGPRAPLKKLGIMSINP